MRANVCTLGEGPGPAGLLTQQRYRVACENYEKWCSQHAPTASNGQAKTANPEGEKYRQAREIAKEAMRKNNPGIPLDV